MSGPPTAAEVAGWADEVAAVGERIGRHFARSEPRDRAAGYVRGLLSDAERKNGWHLAEYLSDPTPDGVPHLLSRAAWDADAVRDDLIGYVAEHLGDPGGVLIVDETGFPKKGAKSCGVARPYSGTAGRVENCQIGVFLGYMTPKGRALPDRALYRPMAWAADADRRKEAGVPKAAGFATKIVPARRTVDRAVAAGVTATWVTADAVYGSDYHFRVAAEGHGLGYVVGVRSDFAVWAGGGQVRMPAVLAAVPAGGRTRVSCGAGAKGPREYDGALRPVNAPEPETYARWVRIRRGVSDPANAAYFAGGGPPATTLAELVRVAGARWAIEECFELGKGCRGLDEYEVRSWAGWHRHATLSLLALAVVAVIRSRVAEPPAGKKGREAGPAERPRGAGVAAGAGVGAGPGGGRGAGLVGLAAGPPALRPGGPLQAAEGSIAGWIATAVGLDRVRRYRAAYRKLARAFDRLLRDELHARTDRPPW